MYEPILQEDFAVLNASELCKILGDYNRMRLLLLLSDAQERTISEITAKLHSSASLVSHQIRLLKEVHILTTRKPENMSTAKLPTILFQLFYNYCCFTHNNTSPNVKSNTPKALCLWGIFIFKL